MLDLVIKRDPESEEIGAAIAICSAFEAAQEAVLRASLELGRLELARREAEMAIEKYCQRHGIDLEALMISGVN